MNTLAGIGLYGVYYAKCTLQTGQVTGYTGGVQTMGKAISASFEYADSDVQNLYCNNAIGETFAKAGDGGTLTLTLDRLKLDAACDLFGLTKTSSSVTVGTNTTVTGNGYDVLGTEQANPVGVAFIEWNQEDNSRDIHRVTVYRNVTFKMPNVDAQTKGESVEWKTPELEGAVVGGDGTHAWFKTRTFSSQAAAEAYITGEFSA